MFFASCKSWDIADCFEAGLEQMADTVPTAATGTLSTPLHHAFIRSLILSQTVAGYVSLCRTIADAEPPPYEVIEAPLLIVAGSDDKTSPLSGCESISERYKSLFFFLLLLLSLFDLRYSDCCAQVEWGP